LGNDTTKDIVFRFLKEDTKKIIMSFKRNRKKVDHLLDRYLAVAPSFMAKCLDSNRSPEFPCHFWINNHLRNISFFCKQCLEKDNCDFEECFKKYQLLIEFFCKKCKREDKIYCNSQTLRMIKESLKKKEIDKLLEKAIMYFMCSCVFKKESCDKEGYFSDIRLFDIEFRNKAAQTATEVMHFFKNIEDKLKELIRVFITEDIPKNKIYDIAFNIIGLHYLFIADFINKTVFMKTPKTTDEKIISNDNENINVLLYHYLERNGYSEDEIYVKLNEEINTNEIIFRKPQMTANTAILNTEDIQIFISRLIDLYNFPLLENVSLKEILSQWSSQISELLDLGYFHSTNVKSVGNNTIKDTNLSSEFIKYKVYLGLLGLMESIKKTGFSNKIPKIFQEDNLQKLRKHLKVNPVFKKACKALGLSDSTTHTALDSKLKKHPSYEEILKRLELEDYGTSYKKITNFLLYSTEEDIEEWKRLVHINKS
jgi:hypothetical protein